MSRPKTIDGTTQRVTVVLPTSVIARLKGIGRRTATPTSVLVRAWVMERLDLDTAHKQ